MKLYKIIVLLGLLAISSAKAQINDFQAITEIGVSKKIAKDIKAEFQQALSYKENLSLINKVYTDLSLEYSPFKRIEFSVGYRFEYEYKTDYFEKRQRFNFDLGLKHSFDRLKFNLRTRIQARQYLNSNQQTAIYTRFRLKSEYKTKGFPVNPFASAEIFIASNGYNKGIPEAYRLNLGAVYKLNKHNEIALSFRIEKEVNVNNPKNLYILMPAYEYRF